MEGWRSGASRLAWPLAAATTGVLAWALQVDGRGPLAWDEAERVNAGADLALAIDSFSPAAAWDWIHDQTFWPFLASAFNGVAYWVTGGDALASAWLPALLAYALAGVLVGRLALALGAGPIGAWLAAALFWLAPIEAKLATGGFTEPAGACVEAGLVLLLIRCGHDSRLRMATAIGGLTAIACWLKYDYGLVALATVGAAGIVVAADTRRWAALAPYTVAVAVAMAAVAALFAFNFDAKLDGLHDYVDPAAPGEIAVKGDNAGDFTYYFRTLLGGDETAIFPPVALLLLAGAIWGVSSWRARPEVRPPLIFLGMWLVLYSLAGAKQERLIGTLLPALCAFGGALAAALWSTRPPGVVRAAGAALLAASLAVQVLRMDDRLAYLEPNPSAAGALAFAGKRVEASDEAVAMLGISRDFPPAALALERRARHAGRPAPVIWVREAAADDRAAVLVDHLRHFRAREVVGVEVLPGSRLETRDYRLNHPSQRHYVRLAHALERGGVLRRVAATRLDSGRLRITVWRVIGRPRLGALR